MTYRKLLNELFGRRWWLFVAPESGLVGGLIFGVILAVLFWGWTFIVLL